MYQFFVEPSQIDVASSRVHIYGGDVNHIKNVLRMHTGEELSVSNGQDGREYRCGILELLEEEILCELRFVKEEGNELPVRVVLYQGLPKADKFETIIQKCVELGVSEIVPVSMRRCVVKLDDKKASSKIARWQSIAEAAAKQSKRSVIPTVRPVMTLGAAIEEAKGMDVRLLPYELAAEKGMSPMDRTRAILEELKPGDSIAIFIGPEGGFDEQEIEAATEAEMEVITLGKRILRTETAGMTVMSWIMLMMEE